MSNENQNNLINKEDLIKKAKETYKNLYRTFKNDGFWNRCYQIFRRYKKSAIFVSKRFLLKIAIFL